MKRLISAVALLAFLAGGAPAFAEAVDSNTKLLVQANNTGSATTFLDTASGAKTITTNGDAKQVAYMLNSTAGFFAGGASDSLVIPDSADWDFGTGDFTVEALVNLQTVGTFWIFSRNVNAEWSWYYDNGDNTLKLSVSNVDVTSRSWTPAANTTYHLAVKRTSGNWTFWIDGVQQGAAYSDSTSFSSAQPVYIWNTSGGIGGRAVGWMKEYRISNVARTITVPSTAYTSDSNTKLLLHFNTTATSPISPWIKFDGSGDYLTVPDSADWDFGTGDFTIDYTVRWNSVGTSDVIEIGNGASVGIRATYASSLLKFVINNVDVMTPSFTPVANRNYNISLERYSGTLYMYIDGLSVGTPQANSDNITGSTAGVRIGSDLSSNDLNGWIRNLRVSNVARHQGASYTPSQSDFVVDANTKLYVKGNEANGATTFIDSETGAKTITTVGNAVIEYQDDYRNTIFTDSGNTGHKPYPINASLAKVDFMVPFGLGAGTFDGTGDYLTLADSADWDFGTGPWAMDGWARWRTVGGSTMMDTGSSAGVRMAIYDTGGTPGFHIYVVNTEYQGSPGFVPVVNTWYHFEADRSSNTLYGFINGTKYIDTSVAGKDITGLSAGLYIGETTGGATVFNGLLDNLRVSNVARHSAVFDPPSSDFSTGRKRSPIFF